MFTTAFGLDKLADNASKKYSNVILKKRGRSLQGKCSSGVEFPIGPAILEEPKIVIALKICIRSLGNNSVVSPQLGCTVLHLSMF